MTVAVAAGPPRSGEDPAEPAGAPPVGRAEAIGLVVGFVALAVAVIVTRWGDFTPDTRPDLYQQPGRFLTSTLQAWVDGATGLGQGNFNAGAAPVAAVIWVIRALGAPAWLAVRIWRLLLLAVAAWGIRRYLGALLGPRLTVTARIVVTVFWVVNPYVIVAGDTTPVLLPYALLPWTMLAFLRATREPGRWRWPAAFALGFFAQTGLNAGVIPFFQLLAIPAHLLHARWVEQRSLRQLGATLARCGVLSVAVSLYWLVPALVASGTGADIAGATESPRDVARTTSYSESARLLGLWPLYGRAGDRLFLGSLTTYLTNPFVVVTTFLVPLGVAASLWWSRARERVLVLGLLAVGLPVMVGMFPIDAPTPAGRALGAVFDRVPASLAFRTTNKVGSVVALAFAVAIALGVRSWQGRVRGARRRVRWTGGVALVAVLAVLAMPIWSGSLHPLGYRYPATWETATADLDAADDGTRVLVVPGGTGGNYRWGMRSPDDLFPSLLGRPVVARNTVVGRGDPSGNLLSGFDVALAQGRVRGTTISTVARLLGAGDVVVRNDTLTEEISGPQPWIVSGQVADDPDLDEIATYGRPGTDTVPGRSGPVDAEGRVLDRANASLAPVEHHRVRDPEPIIRTSPVAGQVLVDGDGEGIVDAAGLGLVDGTRPVRYLGDLDAAELTAALEDGARLVLTDTNRRRAWDINRLANATSPTLGIGDDIDGGNGATVTLWPDDPTRQTVSVFEGTVAGVEADPGEFGLQPFGRAANVVDGDTSTAWTTGTFGTAAGTGITITLDEPRLVDSVTIQPIATEPARIDTVEVAVGGERVAAPLVGGDQAVLIPVEPTRTDRVTVTIVSQTAGTNQVGIRQVVVGTDGPDEITGRAITRLPLTLPALVRDADAGRDGGDALRAALAGVPMDVVLTRAAGSVDDLNDDEEPQLQRRFELPVARSFAFTAELSTREIDPALVSAAAAGDRTCHEVVLVDGELVPARLEVEPDGRRGAARLEGCEPLELAAGPHDVETVFGWRLDQVHLSADVGAGPAPTGSAGTLEVVRDDPTRVEARLGPADGDRYLRLGRAHDERWELEIDGEPAGPPIVVDGYATAWRIDGDARHVVATFPAQQAVRATFVLSAGAVAAAVALAVLPPLPVRRRRSETTAGTP